MAHIDDGGGNKRSSNVEVNIVPFIDLMSVLIIFLLITAVWTQVSMIQIGSSVYGQRTSDEKVEPPPKAEIPFRLDVLPSGHRVIIGKNQINVPKRSGEFDLESLKTKLKEIKVLYPDKIDAIVTMTDELEYVHLINGMDALLVSGFPEISIATAGVE
ncbi:MAG: biopolymer transporter ExbD [Bdellovibrionales bacterium]|nr:biopolymer transporter ExbD [Bdellovibrionales bacterium]